MLLRSRSGLCRVADAVVQSALSLALLVPVTLGTQARHRRGHGNNKVSQYRIRNHRAVVSAVTPFS